MHDRAVQTGKAGGRQAEEALPGCHCLGWGILNVFLIQKRKQRRNDSTRQTKLNLGVQGYPGKIEFQSAGTQHVDAGDVAGRLKVATRRGCGQVSTRTNFSSS